MVGKKVLGTYLLVAIELLLGLGVNRLKWPEMEQIFFSIVLKIFNRVVFPYGWS